MTFYEWLNTKYEGLRGGIFGRDPDITINDILKIGWDACLEYGSEKTPIEDGDREIEQLLNKQHDILKLKENNIDL